MKKATAKDSLKAIHEAASAQRGRNEVEMLILTWESLWIRELASRRNMLNSFANKSTRVSKLYTSDVSRQRVDGRNYPSFQKEDAAWSFSIGFRYVIVKICGRISFWIVNKPRRLWSKWNLESELLDLDNLNRLKSNKCCRRERISYILQWESLNYRLTEPGKTYGDTLP